MVLSVLRADRALGRLARLPLRLVPAGVVVRVLAGPNRGSRWIVGAGPHSCWLGFNEWSKRRLFARMIQPGMVVYDVGANVGSYSVLAASLVRPGGQVMAFEPASENLTFLRKHLDLNNAPNVTVVAAAVWSRSGEVCFEPHADRLQGRVSERGARKVYAITLDDLLRNGARPPSVMKIDVEGGEADVLEGARQLLALHKPLIFVATHGVAVLQRVRLLLHDCGYTLRRVGRSASEWLATPVG